MNVLIARPKLVTFGIGLAVTFVVGAAIGIVDHEQIVAAATQTNTNNGGNAASF